MAIGLTIGNHLAYCHFLCFEVKRLDLDNVALDYRLYDPSTGITPGKTTRSCPGP